MIRYITMEFLGEGIKCFTEDEDWEDLQNDADEWVWQFAESKEQAITQHYSKHDEWCADQNSLNRIKDTY